MGSLTRSVAELETLTFSDDDVSVTTWFLACMLDVFSPESSSCTCVNVNDVLIPEDCSLLSMLTIFCLFYPRTTLLPASSLLIADACANGAFERCLDGSMRSDDVLEDSSSESMLSISDSEFALMRLMTDFDMFEPRPPLGTCLVGILDYRNLTPPPTLLFDG